MKRILILLFCALPLAVFAAWLENLPSEVVQPDGTVLQLYASGDEYANRLHDAAGYTIIQSQVDGYYYYAIPEAGEPAPSQWRVGEIDPRQLGIQPHLTISRAARERKIALMHAHDLRDARGPNTGLVNNINIFIRFSDQTEFELSRGFYDARFNATGAGTNSLRNYFHRVSYDLLDYQTHHYPVCDPALNLSYQDSHPRSYYMPYNAITNPNGYLDFDQRALREQTLLANAVAAIASQVPSTLNIDADNNNRVDNVCFIIRGPHTAWNDLLWAHRWVLYYADAYINGKLVWDFTFQPEDHNSVRTLCHEMFHSVGAPDLYHYTYNGITPAGCWDIMESGNGHMGAYMKYKYGGWISSVPLATEGGTYTLNPVTSPTNNIYRYNISGSDQFLIFEYRKQDADIFESTLPGSGLLIYRINPSLDGNANGPPDEVYIFRPNGTVNVNGQIADATFSADALRTEFNSFTNPSAFLINGSPFEVNIHSISAAGETISFQISSPSANLPPVISSISPVSGSILANTDFEVTAQVSAPNGGINVVDFHLDGIYYQSLFEPPYTIAVDGAALELGVHEISVWAQALNGLSSSKLSQVRIVDPANENWFSWLTAAPVWDEYGRGAVPIKAAIDLDLGSQEYLVKGIRFNLQPDPWGTPATPGLVNAKINRFAGGAITEQTLLTIGDLYNPFYEPDLVFQIDDPTVISGQIAVILDLFEYQNLVFDTNATSGHTWITEPNRPWTDALGRGILGAGAIELLLQSPYVSSPNLVVPVPALALFHYPNPFSSSAIFTYTLKESSPVTLAIYNLKGQLVKTLVHTTGTAGEHQLVWDGTDRQGRPLPNGIYFCRLTAGKESLTRKLVLHR